ncbi:MAG: DNA pilot protein [Microviridae sp.]|nr:MAG: DNA pilot protein [Microviridae sp.]
MLGRQLERTFSKPCWVGAAIGAVGSVVSSALAKNDKPQDDSQEAGISSSLQGSNAPAPNAQANVSASGSQAPELMKDAFTMGINSVLNKPKSATEMGQDQRAYLDAAFPGMNQWEQAGAGASMAGVEAGKMEQQKQLQAQQIQGQKDIARIQGDNAVKVAKINNHVAMQKMPHDISKINAEVSNIVQNTSLSTTQQAHEMAKIVETQLRSQGIRLSNENLPIIKKKLQAEIERLTYAKSEIGRTAHDMTQVVMGAVEEGKSLFEKASAGVGSAVKNSREFIQGQFKKAGF